MSRQLYTGDTFPAMKLDLTGGGHFDFPASLDSKYLIAIFYRGHW